VPSPPAGKFIVRGDYFQLEFRCGGKSEGNIFPIDDFLGLRYLRHLIMHPGEGFSWEELYFRVGGRALSARGSKVDPCEAASTGCAYVAANSFEEPLDEQALRAYKAEVLELEEAIAEERRAGFHERAAVLEAKRDFILNHVAESRRHGRKGDLLHKSPEKLSSSSRNQNKAASRVIQLIQKAMQDAGRRIEKKGMEDLVEHLRRHVVYKSGSWVYFPPVPPWDWTFL
jgi:hypothetical protein